MVKSKGPFIPQSCRSIDADAWCKRDLRWDLSVVTFILENSI